MAELDLSKATTTDFTNAVPDFIVDAKALDVGNATGETFHYFDKATQNFGYYFEIPEIYSSANSLATWTTGKGWTSEDTIRKAELDHITGLGTDTFDEIMWNHEVVKLIVGDSFAEIVYQDNDIQKVLINLIPISPERVRIVLKDGLIQHYDVWNGKKWKELPKDRMFHSMNKRIGDQIHGTSQIDACKWIIDARNEALISNRMIERRGRALGIAYYKTNNEGKISYANTQIEKAVKNGEMLGLAEDTLIIKEFPTKSTTDRMQWITYLENFFYQTFGVPRSIATSEGLNEVGGKMSHVNFEIVYGKEQLDLEGDLWNQMATKLKYNRPPSLGGLIQEEEQKNTGQLGLQPNDVEATLTRE